MIHFIRMFEFSPLELVALRKQCEIVKTLFFSKGVKFSFVSISVPARIYRLKEPKYQNYLINLEF